jgi:hypothetical protein
VIAHGNSVPTVASSILICSYTSSPASYPPIIAGYEEPGGDDVLIPRCKIDCTLEDTEDSRGPYRLNVPGGMSGDAVSGVSFTVFTWSIAASSASISVNSPPHPSAYFCATEYGRAVTVPSTLCSSTPVARKWASASLATVPP